MRTINDREYDSRTFRYSQSIDGKPPYQVNFSRVMAERGTSVSSVTWLVESGSATIESETLSNDIASAVISSGTGDISLIKVTATQADGGARVRFLAIKTIDPDSLNDDYGRY
jgi:hypothetical protein